MSKQNVVQQYNGVRFDNTKKRNADTHYIMDEPWKHYAKEKKQSQKATRDRSPQCEMSSIGKVHRDRITELVIAQGSERGRRSDDVWEDHGRETRAAFWDDRNWSRCCLRLSINILQAAECFKWISLMVCKSHPNKVIFKKRRRAWLNCVECCWDED